MGCFSLANDDDTDDDCDNVILRVGQYHKDGGEYSCIKDAHMFTSSRVVLLGPSARQELFCSARGSFTQ